MFLWKMTTIPARYLACMIIFLLLLAADLSLMYACVVPWALCHVQWCTRRSSSPYIMDVSMQVMSMYIEAHPIYTQLTDWPLQINVLMMLIFRWCLSVLNYFCVTIPIQITKKYNYNKPLRSSDPSRYKDDWNLKWPFNPLMPDEMYMHHWNRFPLVEVMVCHLFGTKPYPKLMLPVNSSPPGQNGHHFGRRHV